MGQFQAPFTHADCNRMTPSEKGFNSHTTTQGSWTSTIQSLAPAIPYQTVEDRRIQPDSYVAISNTHNESTSLPKNIRKITKWVTIILLALRVCAWLDAAGLVTCLVMIKPIGSFMDWIIRLTPVAALLHVSYATYYLSRSLASQATNVSSSYMFFVASIDLCLIPLQVLIAILARSQLADPMDDDIIPWQTILGSDSQQHIIVLSTFLLSIMDAALHLISLGLCAFLAIKLWNAAHGSSGMGHEKANLTARRHQKANNSVSTFMTESSNRDSNASLLQNPKGPVSSFKVLDRRNGYSQNMPGTQMNQTRQINRISEHPSRTSGYGQGTYAPLPPNQNQRAFKSGGPEHHMPAEDIENWGTYRPEPTEYPIQGPPELQQLRVPHPESKKVSPAPLSLKAKYDFSNRSPRPLGLHPPTPRGSTPSSAVAFDVRVLRNIDGNSSARRKSIPTWHSVNLESGSDGAPKEQNEDDDENGDIVSIGSVKRSQARVVSSGAEQQTSNAEVKMRKVSAKAAEEGGAGISYNF